MNAMQIAGNGKPVTIGELREYLNELDAAWSSEDVRYLGVFNDQPLYFAGVSGVQSAFMTYHAEFGLVAFPINRSKP